MTLTDVITLDSTSTWTTVYASYPNSPNPTPNSADGSEIIVTVGQNAALAFSPMHVQAKPRDTLVFQFQSGVSLFRVSIDLIGILTRLRRATRSFKARLPHRAAPLSQVAVPRGVDSGL